MDTSLDLSMFATDPTERASRRRRGRRRWRGGSAAGLFGSGRP